MVYQNTTKSLDVKNFSLTAQEVLPRRSSLQQVTTKLGKTGKVRVATRKITAPIDCTTLMFKKPDPAQKGQGYYGGESLTSIVRLALNVAGAKPQIKTIVANSSQIHVSKKSIYVTTPTYMWSPFICPADAMCMPWRGQGQYTTIYGFDLDALAYKYATVVAGTTWNQYSMDENTQ